MQTEVNSFAQQVLGSSPHNPQLSHSSCTVYCGVERSHEKETSLFDLLKTVRGE
jgi:hypothetical protein